MKPKNSTNRSQIQVYLGHYIPKKQAGAMWFGPIPSLLGCVSDLIMLYTVPVFYSKHTEYTAPVFGDFSLTLIPSARGGGYSSCFVVLAVFVSTAVDWGERWRIHSRVLSTQG